MAYEVKLSTTAQAFRSERNNRLIAAGLGFAALIVSAVFLGVECHFLTSDLHQVAHGGALSADILGCAGGTATLILGLYFAKKKHEAMKEDIAVRARGDTIEPVPTEPAHGDATIPTSPRPPKSSPAEALAADLLSALPPQPPSVEPKPFAAVAPVTAQPPSPPPPPSNTLASLESALQPYDHSKVTEALSSLTVQEARDLANELGEHVVNKRPASEQITRIASSMRIAPGMKINTQITALYAKAETGGPKLSIADHRLIAGLL